MLNVTFSVIFNHREYVPKVLKSWLLEFEVYFELKGVLPPQIIWLMIRSMTILDEEYETIITFSLFRPFSSYDALVDGT